MQNRVPTGLYQLAVRGAIHHHLADLGFQLEEESSGVIVAESSRCRVIFDPRQIILFVQRVSSDPSEEYQAYDLGLLLEPEAIHFEFHFQPANYPDGVTMEIHRMVGLLVEHCRPLLEGDDDAWQRINKLATEKESQVFAKLSEAGVRLKEGDTWRELPELESVRVKRANKLVNTVIALVLLVVPFTFTIFMLAAIGMFFLAPLDQRDTGVTLIMAVLGTPTVILQIWIVKRFLLCPYYWETSEHGFAVGGYIKKRFMRWDDVDSVTILPGKGYELKTSGSSIKLGKEALKNVCLEASIWQHLNSVGKAGNLPLSPFALSLWAQIPDTKTEEIHWENPKPAHLLDVLLRFALCEALIWRIANNFNPDAVPALFFVASWPLVWAIFTLTIIKRISVVDDRILLTTALGKQSIPWKSVRSASFLGRWFTQPASLRIHAGILGFARIPWMPEHPNSTRVILAILKRLRQEERFKFLPFPAILLLTAYGDNQNDGS